MKDTGILLHFVIKQDGSSSNALNFYMGVAFCGVSDGTLAVLSEAFYGFS